MILAVTGGPGSGKSTLSRFLCDKHAFAFFDADACVHDLLATDTRIIAAIADTFGRHVVDNTGKINRPSLRTMVFADPKARRRLEAILHPAVRGRWQQQRAVCLVGGRDFLADIPLLFETGGEAHFDLSVTVAASRTTQEVRLAARGLDRATVEALLASQLPMSEKITRASAVVWNDGTEAALGRQADLLIERLISSSHA